MRRARLPAQPAPAQMYTALAGTSNVCGVWPGASARSSPAVDVHDGHDLVQVGNCLRRQHVARAAKALVGRPCHGDLVAAGDGIGGASILQGERVQEARLRAALLPAPGTRGPLRDGLVEARPERLQLDVSAHLANRISVSYI